jgi:hypothetical protein
MNGRWDMGLLENEIVATSVSNPRLFWRNYEGSLNSRLEPWIWVWNRIKFRAKTGRHVVWWVRIRCWLVKLMPFLRSLQLLSWKINLPRLSFLQLKICTWVILFKKYCRRYILIYSFHLHFGPVSNSNSPTHFYISAPQKCSTYLCNLAPSRVKAWYSATFT